MGGSGEFQRTDWWMERGERYATLGAVNDIAETQTHQAFGYLVTKLQTNPGFRYSNLIQAVARFKKEAWQQVLEEYAKEHPEREAITRHYLGSMPASEPSTSFKH